MRLLVNRCMVYIDAVVNELTATVEKLMNVVAADLTVTANCSSLFFDSSVALPKPLASPSMSIWIFLLLLAMLASVINQCSVPPINERIVSATVLGFDSTPK